MNKRGLEYLTFVSLSCFCAILSALGGLAFKLHKGSVKAARQSEKINNMYNK